MPKYYVSSGTMNRIVTEETPMAAATKAIIKEHNIASEDTAFGLVISVSEQGFDLPDGEADRSRVWISTPVVLEATGLSDIYEISKEEIDQNIKALMEAFDMGDVFDDLLDGNEYDVEIDLNDEDDDDEDENKDKNI